MTTATLLPIWFGLRSLFKCPDVNFAKVDCPQNSNRNKQFLLHIPFIAREQCEYDYINKGTQGTTELMGVKWTSNNLDED